MWDIKLQTDKKTEFSRPDIVVIVKDKKPSLLIDVTTDGNRPKVDSLFWRPKIRFSRVLEDLENF